MERAQRKKDKTLYFYQPKHPGGNKPEYYMTQLDAYAIQVSSTASDKAPVHTKTPGNGCKDYKVNALPTQTTGF